jgi:receptor protein-tyrosine kinase
MSRLYEALRKSEAELHEKPEEFPMVVRPTQGPKDIVSGPSDLENAPVVHTRVAPENHLVALSEPQSLAAEKFRVLVTRLKNMRSQRELKSLQITSAGVNEGKTLIAANLAITLARHQENPVLLVEGDLHAPALYSLLGVEKRRGIAEWWANPNASMNEFLCRINDLPLWFLPAGAQPAEPAEILQSSRLAEQFSQIAGLFDWVILDSTPLLPMADANIWNRLVDGTLLVVREAITRVKSLKSGLTSLDNPKLVGIVLNEAAESDEVSYYDRYYAKAKPTSVANLQKTNRGAEK